MMKITRSTATVMSRNETSRIGHMMAPPCLNSSIMVIGLPSVLVRRIARGICAEIIMRVCIYEGWMVLSLGKNERWRARGVAGLTPRDRKSLQLQKTWETKCCWDSLNTVNALSFRGG